MAEGNHAAEANCRRFTAAGGTGVVLRFGWFYGPGAAHSEQMLAQARRHIVMTLGHPGSYQSSIHVADAGTAVAAALGAPAGVYNVADDQPLTKRDFAGALTAAAGVTRGSAAPAGRRRFSGTGSPPSPARCGPPTAGSRPPPGGRRLIPAPEKDGRPPPSRSARSGHAQPLPLPRGRPLAPGQPWPGRDPAYTNEAMAENLSYHPRRGYAQTHRAGQHGFRRVHLRTPVG